jgi:antitoxin MazE
MTTKLIQIGNSKGVRLPKSLIEQAGLRDDVEIELGGGQIVLRAPKSARAGWDEAFAKAVALHGQDADSDWLDAPNDFDRTEWTW